MSEIEDEKKVVCQGGTNANCSECCDIFTNAAKRAAFGYELETAVCACHDICVEDVRDIGVKNRILYQSIPCSPALPGGGCRGGFIPDGNPIISNIRVICADETLSPSTGCDRINNEIEFEVVLNYGGTYVVVTPKDSFSIFWYEFAQFPSGTFYANNTVGLGLFRKELSVIDGSCKVIIIESAEAIKDGNDCVLKIEYKVVDKLWKHENLLVSAIKPYGSENITVSKEFDSNHKIGTCPNSSGL